MENKSKNIRFGANAYEILKACAEEIKSPGMIIGLQSIIWGLEKIAKRAIKIEDPIIIEELSNLMIVSCPDEERKELLKECRVIEPSQYDYDI